MELERSNENSKMFSDLKNALMFLFALGDRGGCGGQERRDPAPRGGSLRQYSPCSTPSRARRVPSCRRQERLHAAAYILQEESAGYC